MMIFDEGGQLLGWVFRGVPDYPVITLKETDLSVKLEKATEVSHVIRTVHLRTMKPNFRDPRRGRLGTNAVLVATEPLPEWFWKEPDIVKFTAW